MPGVNRVSQEKDTPFYYDLKENLHTIEYTTDDKLLIEIRRVFWYNDRNYGSLWGWDQLRNKENIPYSLNRIARLMRCDNLVIIQKRKSWVTTNSKHDYPAWPNILNRSFIVKRPNVVWISDITYIWTFEGWLYLAAIVGLYSCGVVGLAMDKTITGTLTLLFRH